MQSVNNLRNKSHISHLFYASYVGDRRSVLEVILDVDIFMALASYWQEHAFNAIDQPLHELTTADAPVCLTPSTGNRAVANLPRAQQPLACAHAFSANQANFEKVSVRLQMLQRPLLTVRWYSPVRLSVKRGCVSRRFARACGTV